MYITKETYVQTGLVDNAERFMQNKKKRTYSIVREHILSSSAGGQRRALHVEQRPRAHPRCYAPPQGDAGM